MGSPADWEDLLGDEIAAAAQSMCDRDEDAQQGDVPVLTARKLATHVHVSCCELTDATGRNHCEHPPPIVKPLPWTWRARERWWNLRERVARRLAGRRWPTEEE